MPFTDPIELRAILFPRTEKRLLEGYFGGIFNGEGTKFFAATFVRIADIDYEEFEYELERINGSGSSYMFVDHSKLTKSITPEAYVAKSISELIDEKTLLYFSLKFIGVHFENEWFILKTLTFYGDEKTEGELKHYIKAQVERFDFGDNSLFLPWTPITVERDGKAMVIRNVNYEEFKNAPYLVAMLKQTKKEKVNLAFVNYINEEYASTFFEKLKITFHGEYQSFCPLWSNYAMIFPESKSQIIICSLVENSMGKWRLKYFLLQLENKKWYEWVYFSSEEYDFLFFYSDLIIDDLKTISNWDNDDYLDSSCTMDDEVFWKEYVFKEEDGEYLYLKWYDVG